MEEAMDISISAEDLYGDLDEVYTSQSSSEKTVQNKSGADADANDDVERLNRSNEPENTTADLDLYDDIITEEGNKQTLSYNQMCEQYEAVLALQKKLMSENKALREALSKQTIVKNDMQSNFSSLLITARGELDRKNKEITQLRKKLESPRRRREATATASETSLASIDSNFEPMFVSSPSFGPRNARNLRRSPRKHEGSTRDVFGRERQRGRDTQTGSRSRDGDRKTERESECDATDKEINDKRNEINKRTADIRRVKLMSMKQRLEVDSSSDDEDTSLSQSGLSESLFTRREKARIKANMMKDVEQKIADLKAVENERENNSKADEIDKDSSEKPPSSVSKSDENLDINKDVDSETKEGARKSESCDNVKNSKSDKDSLKHDSESKITERKSSYEKNIERRNDEMSVDEDNHKPSKEKEERHRKTRSSDKEQKCDTRRVKSNDHKSEKARNDKDKGRRDGKKDKRRDKSRDKSEEKAEQDKKYSDRTKDSDKRTSDTRRTDKRVVERSKDERYSERSRKRELNDKDYDKVKGGKDKKDDESGTDKRDKRIGSADKRTESKHYQRDDTSRSNKRGNDKHSNAKGRDKDGETLTSDRNKTNKSETSEKALTPNKKGFDLRELLRQKRQTAKGEICDSIKQTKSVVENKVNISVTKRTESVAKTIESESNKSETVVSGKNPESVDNDIRKANSKAQISVAEKKDEICKSITHVSKRACGKEGEKNLSEEKAFLDMLKSNVAKEKNTSKLSAEKPKSDNTITTRLTNKDKDSTADKSVISSRSLISYSDYDNATEPSVLTNVDKHEKRNFSNVSTSNEQSVEKSENSGGSVITYSDNSNVTEPCDLTNVDKHEKRNFGIVTTTSNVEKSENSSGYSDNSNVTEPCDLTNVDKHEKRNFSNVSTTSNVEKSENSSGYSDNSNVTEPCDLTNVDNHEKRNFSNVSTSNEPSVEKSENNSGSVISYSDDVNAVEQSDFNNVEKLEERNFRSLSSTSSEQTVEKPENSSGSACSSSLKIGSDEFSCTNIPSVDLASNNRGFPSEKMEVEETNDVSTVDSSNKDKIDFSTAFKEQGIETNVNEGELDNEQVEITKTKARDSVDVSVGIFETGLNTPSKESSQPRRSSRLVNKQLSIESCDSKSNMEIDKQTTEDNEGSENTKKPPNSRKRPPLCRVISETILSVTTVEKKDSVTCTVETNDKQINLVIGKDENNTDRSKNSSNSDRTSISWTSASPSCRASTSLNEKHVCHKANCRIKVNHLHPKSPMKSTVKSKSESQIEVEGRPYPSTTNIKSSITQDKSLSQLSESSEDIDVDNIEGLTKELDIKDNEKQANEIAKSGSEKSTDKLDAEGNENQSNETDSKDHEKQIGELDNQINELGVKENEEVGMSIDSDSCSKSGSSSTTDSDSSYTSGSGSSSYSSSDSGTSESEDETDNVTKVNTIDKMEEVQVAKNDWKANAGESVEEINDSEGDQNSKSPVNHNTKVSESVDDKVKVGKIYNTHSKEENVKQSQSSPNTEDIRLDKINKKTETMDCSKASLVSELSDCSKSPNKSWVSHSSDRSISTAAWVYSSIGDSEEQCKNADNELTNSASESTTPKSQSSNFKSPDIVAQSANSSANLSSEKSGRSPLLVKLISAVQMELGKKGSPGKDPLCVTEDKQELSGAHVTKDVFVDESEDRPESVNEMEICENQEDKAISQGTQVEKRVSDELKQDMMKANKSLTKGSDGKTDVLQTAKTDSNTSNDKVELLQKAKTGGEDDQSESESESSSGSYTSSSSYSTSRSRSSRSSSSSMSSSSRSSSRSSYSSYTSSSSSSTSSSDDEEMENETIQPTNSPKDTPKDADSHNIDRNTVDDVKETIQDEHVGKGPSNMEIKSTPQIEAQHKSKTIDNKTAPQLKSNNAIPGQAKNQRSENEGLDKNQAKERGFQSEGNVIAIDNNIHAIERPNQYRSQVNSFSTERPNQSQPQVNSLSSDRPNQSRPQTNSFSTERPNQSQPQVNHINTADLLIATPISKDSLMLSDDEQNIQMPVVIINNQNERQECLDIFTVPVFQRSPCKGGVRISNPYFIMDAPPEFSDDIVNRKDIKAECSGTTVIKHRVSSTTSSVKESDLTKGNELDGKHSCSDQSTKNSESTKKPTFDETVSMDKMKTDPDSVPVPELMEVEPNKPDFDKVSQLDEPDAVSEDDGCLEEVISEKVDKDKPESTEERNEGKVKNTKADRSTRVARSSSSEKQTANNHKAGTEISSKICKQSKGKDQSSPRSAKSKESVKSSRKSEPHKNKSSDSIGASKIISTTGIVDEEKPRMEESTYPPLRRSPREKCPVVDRFNASALDATTTLKTVKKLNLDEHSKLQVESEMKPKTAKKSAPSSSSKNKLPESKPRRKRTQSFAEKCQQLRDTSKELSDNIMKLKADQILLKSMAHKFDETKLLEQGQFSRYSTDDDSTAGTGSDIETANRYKSTSLTNQSQALKKFTIPKISRSADKIMDMKSTDKSTSDRRSSSDSKSGRSAYEKKSTDESFADKNSATKSSYNKASTSKSHDKYSSKSEPDRVYERDLEHLNAYDRKEREDRIARLKSMEQNRNRQRTQTSQDAKPDSRSKTRRNSGKMKGKEVETKRGKEVETKRGKEVETLSDSSEDEEALNKIFGSSTDSSGKRSMTPVKNDEHHEKSEKTLDKLEEKVDKRKDKHENKVERKDEHKDKGEKKGKHKDTVERKKDKHKDKLETRKDQHDNRSKTKHEFESKVDKRKDKSDGKRTDKHGDKAEKKRENPDDEIEKREEKYKGKINKIGKHEDKAKKKDRHENKIETTKDKNETVDSSKVNETEVLDMKKKDVARAGSCHTNAESKTTESSDSKQRQSRQKSEEKKKCLDDKRKTDSKSGSDTMSGSERTTEKTKEVKQSQKIAGISGSRHSSDDCELKHSKNKEPILLKSPGKHNKIFQTKANVQDTTTGSKKRILQLDENAIDCPFPITKSNATKRTNPTKSDPSPEEVKVHKKLSSKRNDHVPELLLNENTMDRVDYDDDIALEGQFSEVESSNVESSVAGDSCDDNDAVDDSDDGNKGKFNSDSDSEDDLNITIKSNNRSKIVSDTTEDGELSTDSDASVLKVNMQTKVIEGPEDTQKTKGVDSVKSKTASPKLKISPIRFVKVDDKDSGSDGEEKSAKYRIKYGKKISRRITRQPSETDTSCDSYGKTSDWKISHDRQYKRSPKHSPKAKQFERSRIDSKPVSASPKRRRKSRSLSPRKRFRRSRSRSPGPKSEISPKQHSENRSDSRSENRRHRDRSRENHRNNPSAHSSLYSPRSGRRSSSRDRRRSPNSDRKDRAPPIEFESKTKEHKTSEHRTSEHKTSERRTSGHKTSECKTSREYNTGHRSRDARDSYRSDRRDTSKRCRTDYSSSDSDGHRDSHDRSLKVHKHRGKDSKNRRYSSGERCETKPRSSKRSRR